MEQGTLAAQRDASFFDSPGKAGKYHVVVDGEPACNRNATFAGGSHCPMPLILERARPVADVHPALRCRRPACARLWTDA